MEQYKINFESLAWEDSPVGVRSKTYEQGDKRLRLAEFAKEFTEPGWCTKGHIGYVLEGQMEIDFNGRTILLDPGDGVFIPADEEHRHKGRVVSESVMVILVEDI
ncbi:MAG: cupin domain-containing protein [Planctomycetota bacterium]|jgi:quercetin dioxygenase-like cupin family protein